MIKKPVFAILLTLAALSSSAEVTESRDLFFRSGKYYVVVAVLVILFLFLAVYLFRLDKKVSDLEKEESEK